jgi:telomere resolvase
MAVPRWLHTYWMQQFWPALSQGEITADRVRQLLEESLQSFQQRSGTNTQRPLSEQTIGRYVTATRNWLRDDLPGVQLVPADCRKLSASEMTLVLQHFNPPAQWWAALNDRSRERVEQRPQVLLPDPQGIMTRIHELLGKEDWAPLAVALAGATGRRVGEVIYSGSVTPKSGYSIFFRGRLKRGGDMQRDFEIPTLVEAPLVLEAWERLRTHPEIAAMDFPGPGSSASNQVLQVINQRLSPVVRKVADHYFQDLVPTSPEDEEEQEFQRWGLYTHLLRSIYRSIAIWLYCPIHTNPEAFGATILGHTYKQGEGTSVERLNFSTEHYYHRYAISDGHGQVDGRRGIRLGEPGVSVLEAFEKDYAMQLQTADKASLVKNKGKKKVVGKRTSKTGFSSLRPRVATREWFDQVAEENDLAWKDTDATILLLLRIYEEHKQCESSGAVEQSPERVAPDLLGLSGELAGRIEQAMKDQGQTSFHAFLAQALDREANVQIGLAKHRLAREKADLTSVPLSKISNTRRPEAAYERIRRAIATIVDYNRGCSDPNGFWYINVSLIREYTGASPDFIRPVLQANAELLQRHHEHFHIIAAHNRTPTHRATPITKDPALVIPEDPTQIQSLSEIALPVLSDSTEDTSLVEAQS